IVVAIPISLALSLRTTGWQRWGFVSTAVLGVGVIRVTGTDAGRGALIVAVGAFVLGLALMYRRSQLTAIIAPATRGRLQAALGALCAIGLGVVIFFYPSDSTGSSSNITDLTATGGSKTGTANAPEAATIDT